METLALWRDISLVWLIVLCLIPIAIPGVLLYFGQKYLRIGRKKLKSYLQIGQVWAKRAETETYKAARRVIEVPIQVQANVARAQTTAQAVRDELLGKQAPSNE